MPHLEQRHIDDVKHLYANQPEQDVSPRTTDKQATTALSPLQQTILTLCRKLNISVVSDRTN